MDWPYRTTSYRTTSRILAINPASSSIATDLIIIAAVCRSIDRRRLGPKLRDTGQVQGGAQLIFDGSRPGMAFDRLGRNDQG